MNTLALAHRSTHPLDPAGALFRSEPLFAGAAVVLLAMIPPTLIAGALDERTLNGVNVWVKPLKFEVALTVYFATLAWFAAWLPQGTRDAPRYRVFSAAVVAAAAAEMLWIGGAAANGIASHFNNSSPLMAGIYGLMGLFAVLLTSASLVYGVLILRDRNSASLTPPLRLSLGLGLVLTFALTIIAAGVLASQTGHAIGAEARASGDAGGLAFMGWSRSAGDLRVAHFFATHAMHVLPAVGVLLSRLAPVRAAVPAVWLAAAVYTAFVAAVFIEALLGQPFLP